MKKFKCTVTKETTMEIEIDDSVWTDEQIVEWQRYFYESKNIEDVVTHIARMKSECANGAFMEGFGIPMINGEKPYLSNDSNITESINICNQESYIDTKVEEI